jgi:CHAD domain-containing protein
MKQLIKQLKLLQNNLGNFNDLSVQQDMLKYTLSVLKPGTVKAKKTSASIGGLLTNLYHESREVRTHFEETFAAFSAKSNLALYRKLFG